MIAAVLLPLAPLLAERVAAGSVSVTGWMVTAIVFCASLAVYTQNAFVFVASFLVIMSLAFLYGLSVLDSGNFGAIGISSSIWAMVFYGITHCAYRFDFHVTKGNDFIRIRSINSDK